MEQIECQKHISVWSIDYKHICQKPVIYSIWNTSSGGIKTLIPNCVLFFWWSSDLGVVPKIRITLSPSLAVKKSPSISRIGQSIYSESSLRSQIIVAFTEFYSSHEWSGFSVIIQISDALNFIKYFTLSHRSFHCISLDLSPCILIQYLLLLALTFPAVIPLSAVSCHMFQCCYFHCCLWASHILN